MGNKFGAGMELEDKFGAGMELEAELSEEIGSTVVCRLVWAVGHNWVESDKAVVGMQTICKELLLGLFCCKNCKERQMSSFDLVVGILDNSMVYCSTSDKTEVGSKLVVGIRVVCVLGN